MSARVRFLEAAQDNPLILGSAPPLPRVWAKYQMMWQEALGAEAGVEGRVNAEIYLNSQQGMGSGQEGERQSPLPTCDIPPTPPPHAIFGEGLR